MGNAKRPTLRFSLTAVRLRQLELPAKGYVLVWDTKVRRLAVSVLSTGVMKWKFIFTLRGETKWMTLGDTRDVTTAQARARAEELTGFVAAKRDPRREEIERQRADTFWELMDKFLEEYAYKTLKRPEQLHYLLGRLPVSFLDLKANAVTTMDVGNVIRPLSDRPVLARQVLAAISSVFGWGMDFGLVTSNPCRSIRRRRFKTKSRDRVLDDAEIRLFWEAFGRRGEAGRALRLLLLTGQRPGEVAALRLEDLRGQWWTLPGKWEGQWCGTKNGLDHTVWIPTAAMALLPKSTPTADPDDWLKWREAPARLKRAMWKAMREISAELNVKPATSHDLRRTHGTTITRLLGFGGAAAMDRIQNHVRRGVTGTYDRNPYDAETRRAMEMVAAHIAGVVEGRDVGDKVVVGDFRKQ